MQIGLPPMPSQKIQHELKYTHTMRMSDGMTVCLQIQPDYIIFTDTFQPNAPFVIATAHCYFFIIIFYLFSCLSLAFFGENE